MGELIRDLKAGLRARVFELVSKIPAEVRVEASMNACQLMQRQALWRRARSVLLFAPVQGELDIWPLLEAALAQGKETALPRFQKETGRYIACSVRNLDTDVSVGHWNIREPRAHCAETPLNRLDLILVPGVAFDLHGRRVGRGKGFYDQILAAAGGSTCGTAFDEQIVSEVPVEPHDIQ
ncbi:MAG: 5-formyltetrahydrofolate cyclo-ligase, partial [Limisphaerales bacterium]